MFSTLDFYHEFYLLYPLYHNIIRNYTLNYTLIINDSNKFVMFFSLHFCFPEMPVNVFVFTTSPSASSAAAFPSQVYGNLKSIFKTRRNVFLHLPLKMCDDLRVAFSRFCLVHINYNLFLLRPLRLNRELIDKHQFRRIDEDWGIE